MYGLLKGSPKSIPLPALRSSHNETKPVETLPKPSASEDHPIDSKYDKDSEVTKTILF